MLYHVMVSSYGVCFVSRVFARFQYLNQGTSLQLRAKIGVVPSALCAYTATFFPLILNSTTFSPGSQWQITVTEVYIGILDNTNYPSLLPLRIYPILRN